MSGYYLDEDHVLPNLNSSVNHSLGQSSTYVTKSPGPTFSVTGVDSSVVISISLQLSKQSIQDLVELTMDEREKPRIKTEDIWP